MTTRKTKTPLTARRASTVLIQAYIDAHYTNVEFVKGGGYFYLAAKDAGQRSDVDILKSTSIYTFSLQQLSLGEWIERVDALLKPDVACAWFAMCANLATTTRSHPILGEVPICKRCDAKVAAVEALLQRPEGV